MTTPEIKPRAVQLPASGLEQQQFIRNIWCVKPSESQRFEDLLQPLYWSHVAAKLRAKDKLEILPVDNSYYAELLVISTTPTSAKVEVINFVDFRQKEEEKSSSSVVGSGYSVHWRGPSAKWSVERNIDKHRVQAQFATEEEANEFLKEHLKKSA